MIYGFNRALCIVNYYGLTIRANRIEVLIEHYVL